MHFSVLYLAPGLIFLFWSAVHCLLAPRTRAFKILMWTMLTIFVSATGDLLLGEWVKSESIALMVIQLMTPAIIPFNCMYFSQLNGKSQHRPYQALWVILPAMLFTASLIITSIYGVSNTNAFLGRMRAGYTGDALFTNAIERTYYFCSVIVFRWAILVEAAIMVIHILILHRRYHFSPAHWIDFLFKNGRIRVLEIQITLSLLILTGLCIKLFLHHPLLLSEKVVMNVLVILISIIDFFFGFFALFSAREFISVPEIRTAFRFNYAPETEESVAEEIITSTIPLLHTESLARVHSRLEMQAGAEVNARNADASPTLTSAILGVASSNLEEASLLSRFQHLMMEEKLFLRPSLTLSDVAERLHTNKTYVSKMVNRSYNLGFPEVLNILRVDYAEHYIRKHNEATQDEIARACGFLSASSFNSTFKRITGYTPKVWAARTSSKKV